MAAVHQRSATNVRGQVRLVSLIRMSIELRPATSGDGVHIIRALFAAWQWRHPWDEMSFQQHLASKSPDSYVDDFGRRDGDAGVIAEDRTTSGRQFAGAAWYRFFTVDAHRAGFVAEDMLELVIAVEEGYRGWARRAAADRAVQHRGGRWPARAEPACQRCEQSSCEAAPILRLPTRRRPPGPRKRDGQVSVTVPSHTRDEFCSP